jgi:Fe-S-cluster-containing hydrogenase component 2
LGSSFLRATNNLLTVFVVIFRLKEKLSEERLMSDQKSDEMKISRRQFMAGAGTLLVLGSVPKLVTGAPATEKPGSGQIIKGVPVSPLIVHDPNLCAGCGVCGLMCAFSHEKEFGPSLSRNELVRDPFTADYTFLVCQQCSSPDCYFACPNKDQALCVDKKTGIKYINTSKCEGCGACTEACRFTPPRANVHPAKKVSFKCDLCRDRAEGPICVEYCTTKALRKVSGKERG